MCDVELKDCPFCGCEAKIERYTLVDWYANPDYEDYDDGKKWWHVVCTRCEVVLNNGWPSQQEAADEWNKRTAVIN